MTTATKTKKPAKNKKPVRLLLGCHHATKAVEKQVATILFENIIRFKEVLADSTALYLKDPIEDLRVIHEAIGVLFQSIGESTSINFEQLNYPNGKHVLELLNEPDCEFNETRLVAYKKIRDTKEKLLQARRDAVFSEA